MTMMLRVTPKRTKKLKKSEENKEKGKCSNTEGEESVLNCLIGNLFTPYRKKAFVDSGDQKNTCYPSDATKTWVDGGNFKPCLELGDGKTPIVVGVQHMEVSCWTYSKDASRKKIIGKKRKNNKNNKKKKNKEEVSPQEFMKLCFTKSLTAFEGGVTHDRLSEYIWVKNPP